MSRGRTSLCCARVLLENRLGRAFCRAHLVGKWTTPALLLRFGPHGGTAVISSPCCGCHLLAARRQSSVRRAEAVSSLPRRGGHRLAARRLSSARSPEAVISARRAEAVIGSPHCGGHRLAALRSHRLAARRWSSARCAAVGLLLQGSWPGFVFYGSTVMVVPGRPGRKSR